MASVNSFTAFTSYGNPLDLILGTRLGRYEIRSKLGAGGMGEVYLALDTEPDRTVAIKILPRALASNERRLQRLRSATSPATGQSTPATVSGAAATLPASAAPVASSAEYIVSGIKQHELVAAIAVVVLTGVAVALGFYFHARNTEVAIESIAVLPFQNRNTEADTEYLFDALAESLIYRLSQLPNQAFAWLEKADKARDIILARVSKLIQDSTVCAPIRASLISRGASGCRSRANC